VGAATLQPARTRAATTCRTMPWPAGSAGRRVGPGPCWSRA